MNENRNPSLEENDFLLLAHDELNSPTIFIRSSLSDEKSTRKFDNNSNRSELALTPSITPTPSNCLCLNESSRESTSFSINVISNSNSDTTDDESYYPAILPPRSLLPSHKFPEWNQNSNSNLFSKPETSTADVKKDYSSKILRLYDPSYEGISSSLQMVPNDRLRRLIHPTQSSLDFALHINFAVSHNQIAELTEPVFANLALYSINNNSNSANLSTSTPTATRVSECLHIDLSPDHIKARFAYVYENADDLKDGPISDRAVPIKSEKSRTATGRDAITMTINEHCFVTLPTNINKNDLYIVIQLTKVLTPENEKTGSRLRSTREERLVTDPDEAYRRLHKYRQIIGLGVMKVYPGADGIVAGEGDVLRCLISPFKASINSTVIAQVSIFGDKIIDFLFTLFTSYSWSFYVHMYSMSKIICRTIIPCL